jgi:hypothetical protein
MQLLESVEVNFSSVIQSIIDLFCTFCPGMVLSDQRSRAIYGRPAWAVFPVRVQLGRQVRSIGRNLEYGIPRQEFVIFSAAREHANQSATGR